MTFHWFINCRHFGFETISDCQKLYNFRSWNKIMTYYDELQRSVCHQILVKPWGKRGNGCFCPLTDYSAIVAHWTIYCPRLPIVRLILTFSDPFLASSIVYHGNGKLKVIYIKKIVFMADSMDLLRKKIILDKQQSCLAYIDTLM